MFFYEFLHIDTILLADYRIFLCLQLCAKTGCCPKNLAGTINDRGEWREREPRLSVWSLRLDDDDDNDDAKLTLPIRNTFSLLLAHFGVILAVHSVYFFVFLRLCMKLRTHTHTHTNTHIYIYIYIYICHQVALSVRVTLTFSGHPSLSSITSSRSSRLHPESTQSCCM